MAFFNFLRGDKNCFKYSVLHAGQTFFYLFYCLDKHTDLLVSYTITSGYSSSFNNLSNQQHYLAVREELSLFSTKIFSC